MNIKNIYRSFFMAGLILTGCDSSLDIEPNDSVDEGKAITTSADVEGVLVGAYNSLSSGNLLGGNVLRDSELLGDDGEIIFAGTFVAPGDIYAKTMLVTNDQAQATWQAAYTAINNCNLILSNLDLVTEDRRDRVEGEAKFIRGTVYFELIRLYARTWVDGNPATNPGVPLVTEPTTLETATAKVARAKVSEVYTQILNDLTDAETLLPEVNGIFATTYSASAVLSRVYMTQQDYGNAAIAADRVIESGYFSLNPGFADAFNNTSSQSIDRDRNGNASTEDIFAIQLTNQDGVNNMNTFFASADYSGRGDIFLLYDDDLGDWPHLFLYESGDRRLSMLYDDGFDLYSAKFNNLFGNVPYIRLSEMYLTRAEANYEDDSSVGAEPLDDINVIRARAGLPPLVSVSIDDIYKERRVELAFEGHKLHDYKRTRRDIGSFSFDDPRLIFPIPQRETLINPDLEQNEGYD